MGECQDLHARTLFSIGDREREPPQHKSAGVVLAGWPTPRRFDNQRYGAIYFSDEFLSGRLAALQIPLHGRFQFRKCGGMNLDPLAGHFLPAMKYG